MSLHAKQENRFFRVSNRANKAAGVKKVRFHDLRNTHATLLLEAGADLKKCTCLHQNNWSRVRPRNERNRRKTVHTFDNFIQKRLGSTNVVKYYLTSLKILLFQC